MKVPQRLNKSDTQETADESIASEDAIAQVNDGDDSSGGNRRSNDCVATDSHTEEGKGNQKLLGEIEGQKVPDRCLNRKGKWQAFFKNRNSLRYTVGVGVLLVAVGAIIVLSVASKDSAVPGEEEDRFDFSDFDEKETHTISATSQPSIAPKVPLFIPATPSPTTPRPTTPSPTTPRPTTPSPTSSPTNNPSTSPSLAPSTAGPTVSNAPSSIPSSSPTYVPTVPVAPVPRPPIVPFEEEDSDSFTTFCVIADAPYTEEELDQLPRQIATQMEGCEFLVHLGDIFIGDTVCDITDYQAMQDIMLESHAPAFLVPGDNEWNDCMREFIDIGWNHWTNHFVGFEDNWNHTLSIVRQEEYEENFYFIEKRTLFIGINIVGGRVHNQTEWKTRLLAEYNWVSEIMIENLVDTNTTDGVVLMAHAHPSEEHSDFFNPFRVFLRDELENEFPVLYLHGDGHNFMYTPNYLNQSNFLRIQHEGGTIEPVLKIKAGPGRGPDGRSSVYDAFQFDRQLGLLKEKRKDKKD